MESLHLQLPTWYLLLCIFAGVVFAAVMYFKDRTFVDQPRAIRWMMTALRFCTVTLLSALLLSPFLKLYKQTTQDPILVIAQDASKSVGETLGKGDSVAYMNQLDAFSRALDGKFNVHKITFGEDVHEGDTAHFDEQMTDISQAIAYITDHYGDQNLGAIVLATDGIFNRGTNPLYSGQSLRAPIHTVALGDTTIQTDLLIVRVLHNNISFLGDKFPVQVDIAGRRLSGRSATVTLQKIEGGNTIKLAEEPIRIDRDNFFETREFLIDASTPGVNRYRVRLSGVSGDENYSNNIKDFYIEVIDGRLKVLVVGTAPHPDLGALEEIITSNDNYEVDVVLAEDFDGQVADYDLAILHQLPSQRHPAQILISELDKQEIPRLFVLGESTQLARFNSAQNLLSIQGGPRSSNEVTAIVDQGFQLFTVPDNIESQMRGFAPLNAPFGDYSVNPAANVYMYQRIGNVDTQFPLILFGRSGNAKVGIIAAEGIWKWRLFDYLQNDSHELTNTLVNKLVQYTTVKDDKRRFRASPSKNLYQDNETILFDAELYNQSYELINDPEAFLNIRGPAGNEYNYTFNRTQNSYAIDIGKFAVGDYSYTAFTEYLGQRHQVNGRFSVQPIQLESYVTTANHGLLRNLSAKYGGELYYPADLAALQERLLADEQIKPVLFQSVRNQPVIHLKWLFLAFLLLLGLEWFMRRYYGGY